MIIDFHTHCFPDRLAERAMRELSGKIGIAPCFDGTYGGLKALLERAGIGAAVICNVSTNERQVKAVNDFAISTNCGNTVSFGSIHPLFEGYRDEIDRLCAAGIAGLKFHPDYQNYFVDDEKMYPVYEYASGKGMILHFHTGLDLGLPGTVKAPPDRLVNVVNTFPRAKIVAAHMGGYLYADLAQKLLSGKDIYMDTSASLSTLGKRRAERFIKAHGAHRILFGTDAPWFVPEKETAFIDSLSLTAEEKEMIFVKNAEKLLWGGHKEAENRI